MRIDLSTKVVMRQSPLPFFSSHRRWSVNPLCHNVSPHFSKIIKFTGIETYIGLVSILFQKYLLSMQYAENVLGMNDINKAIKVQEYICIYYKVR